jgi:hypothetical protein
LPCTSARHRRTCAGQTFACVACAPASVHSLLGHHAWCAAMSADCTDGVGLKHTMAPSDATVTHTPEWGLILPTANVIRMMQGLACCVHGCACAHSAAGNHSYAIRLQQHHTQARSQPMHMLLLLPTETSKSQCWKCHGCGLQVQPITASQPARQRKASHLAAQLQPRHVMLVH